MKIAVVNVSKRVSAADFADMVGACRAQLVQHVCPAHDLVAPEVVAAADLSEVPADHDIVLLQDDPDVDGALGYHSEQDDRVFGRVFASPVLDNGGVVLAGADPSTPTVSSVLSHELAELVADKFVNVWVDGPRIDLGGCYSYELADPCQGDSYFIDGAPSGARVAVSNFVLPSWFDDQAPAGSKVDFMGRCPGPFRLSPGGYFVVRDAPGTEQQVFGEHLPPEWRLKKHPRSRNRRRLKK